MIICCPSNHLCIKIGCRGYIILICNVLRLTSDLQSLGEYIPGMLIGHHTWNEFVPKLRSDTQAQIYFNPELSDSSFPRPPPHVGPLQSQPDEVESQVVRRFFPNDTIDLGSLFAYSLGFVSKRDDDDDEEEATTPVERKKAKKKKRKAARKLKARLSSAGLGDLTGASPGHSNGSSVSGTDDEDDDDNDDESGDEAAGAHGKGHGNGTAAATAMAAGATLASTLPQPVKYVQPPVYTEESSV